MYKAIYKHVADTLSPPHLYVAANSIDPRFDELNTRSGNLISCYLVGEDTNRLSIYNRFLVPVDFVPDTLDISEAYRLYTSEDHLRELNHISIFTINIHLLNANNRWVVIDNDGAVVKLHNLNHPETVYILASNFSSETHRIETLNVFDILYSNHNKGLESTTNITIPVIDNIVKDKIIKEEVKASVPYPFGFGKNKSNFDGYTKNGDPVIITSINEKTKLGSGIKIVNKSDGLHYFRISDFSLTTYPTKSTSLNYAMVKINNIEESAQLFGTKRIKQQMLQSNQFYRIVSIELNKSHNKKETNINYIILDLGNGRRYQKFLLSDVTFDFSHLVPRQIPSVQLERGKTSFIAIKSDNRNGIIWKNKYIYYGTLSTSIHDNELYRTHMNPKIVLFDENKKFYISTLKNFKLHANFKITTEEESENSYKKISNSSKKHSSFSSHSEEPSDENPSISYYTTTWITNPYKGHISYNSPGFGSSIRNSNQHS